MSARLHDRRRAPRPHAGRVQEHVRDGQQTTRDDLLWRIPQPASGAHRAPRRAGAALPRLHPRTPTSCCRATTSADIAGAAADAARRPHWRLRLPGPLRMDDFRFHEPAVTTTTIARNDVGAEVERQYGLCLARRPRLCLRTAERAGFDRHRLPAARRDRRLAARPRPPRRADRTAARTPPVSRSEPPQSLARLLRRPVRASWRCTRRVRLRPRIPRQRVCAYDQPDSVCTRTPPSNRSNCCRRRRVAATDPGARTARRIPAQRQRASIAPTTSGGSQGSVTYTLGGTLWLQFTDEVGLAHAPGRRRPAVHRLPFNWSTLYLAWKPLPRLGIDLFFELDPRSTRRARRTTPSS